MKLLYSILLLCISFSCYSQNSDLGNWLIYFGNKKMNNNFNWHNEVQYRNYNIIGDLEQLLLRTGLGYNLTENNNNVLLGYGYILSQNYTSNSEEKINIKEHRIYQQFITRQNLNDRVLIQHRYRFEQRFIEEDFRLRFRYFLGFNVPINVTKTVYISAYNEIFLNTENNVFDRNRLYGGLGYKPNSTLKFELGYMNQFLNNGNRDQVNFMTFVNF